MTAARPTAADASAGQAYEQTVTPVNDVPSFAVADLTVLEDAGLRAEADFAAPVSAGPADEASQVVSFAVTNDDNPLYVTQPSIDATDDTAVGTLRYLTGVDLNTGAL